MLANTDDHVGTESDGDRARCATFATFWAVAECLHVTFMPANAATLPGLVALSCAVAVLLRPSSKLRLLGLCLAEIARVVSLSPETANHILYNSLINATICLVIARHWRRRGDASESNRAFVAELSTLLLIEFCALYFFAVLHKLNWDYFRPETSCGAEMAAQTLQRFIGGTLGPSARLAAVWGTLLIEITIPVMVLLPRLRYAGILTALVFHLALTLFPNHGIYSFSAMLYALLILILPDAVFQRARQIVSALVTSPERRRTAAVVWAFTVGLAIVGLAARVVRRNPSTALVKLAESAGFLLWMSYALTALLIILAVWRAGKNGRTSSLGGLSVLRSPGAIILPIIILNSLAPYLGMQTVRVLSMFSNLRTEGGVSNHLFIPVEWQVADYQRDLVEIVDSSDPRLDAVAQSQLLLPYFELRRHIWRRPQPVTVTFRRNGVVTQIDTSRDDAATRLPPVGWLEGKVLAFRPVDREGPCVCRW